MSDGFLLRLTVIVFAPLFSGVPVLLIGFAVARRQHHLAALRQVA